MLFPRIWGLKKVRKEVKRNDLGSKWREEGKN